MSDSTVILLANPAAGRGRALKSAEAAAAKLRTFGASVELVVPESAEDADIAARQAVARVPSAIVACGGDGTMNVVLQAVAMSAVPFAILPCGTGNDNARGLGMPVDPVIWATAVAASISQPRVRRIDLARAQTGGPGRWFLGVLSTGFDSCVNERANRMEWPRGRAKYLVGIAAELRSFKPVAYSVSVDGIDHSDEGMLVCVGNGSSYGGGMRVCPTAHIQDGLLDVTWVGPLKTSTFLRVFPSVFRGTHVENPAVRVLRGREIRIQAAGQVAYADGERLGDVPVDISVVPDALHVLDLAD
jgi:diacylglycerol kinase (ATP)